MWTCIYICHPLTLASNMGLAFSLGRIFTNRFWYGFRAPCFRCGYRSLTGTAKADITGSQLPEGGHRAALSGGRVPPVSPHSACHGPVLCLIHLHWAGTVKSLLKAQLLDGILSPSTHVGLWPLSKPHPLSEALDAHDPPKVQSPLKHTLQKGLESPCQSLGVCCGLCPHPERKYPASGNEN